MEGSDFEISQELKPAMEVRYVRKQYWHEESGSRVTVDYELNFNLPDQRDSSIFFNNLVIIEVKKERAAVIAPERIFKQFNLRAESMSKYCLGVVLLREEVKKNNFRPLIKMIEKWNS